MEESFTKENAYTLGVHLREASKDAQYTKGEAKLSRYFNFLSCQVTTVFREKLFEGGSSQVAGMGALSSQMQIENFSDIQSDAEIKLMHRKLLDLQGSPPPIDDILRTVTKPAAPSALRAQNP